MNNKISYIDVSAFGAEIYYSNGDIRIVSLKQLKKMNLPKDTPGLDFALWFMTNGCFKKGSLIKR